MTDEARPQDWSNVPLCEIPADAQNDDGSGFWDAFTSDTGMSREELLAVQQKHLKKDGTPRDLHIVVQGPLWFIFKPLNQKEYRDLGMKQAEDERKLAEILASKTPPIKLTESDVNFLMGTNTCSMAVIVPESFDFMNDDLPPTLVANLYTEIMFRSGIQDVMLTKKL